MVGSLLGLLHVEADGLEYLHQKSLELEAVHGVDQVHRNELVGIEVLKLVPQPLHKDVEIDPLAEIEPGSEGRQRQQWDTGSAIGLQVELNAWKRDVVLPQVEIEQSEVGAERGSRLLDPGAQGLTETRFDVPAQLPGEAQVTSVQAYGQKRY